MINKSVSWESYPIIFFRLAQHSSQLLTKLRWQRSLIAKFEELFELCMREELLQRQLTTYQHNFDTTSWTAISRWLEHMHLRKEGPLPLILNEHAAVSTTVHQLIRVRRTIVALQSEIPRLLQDEFMHLWQEASSLVSDQTLHTALAYTSWDFMSALENMVNSPEHISIKKRRSLLSSLGNYIARGSVKTCPLGFMCGTAIGHFAESDTREPIEITPPLYATVMPSRALLNGLIERISSTVPIEQLGVVHLDVSHSVENGKIVFWRASIDSEQIVEQLQTIKMNRVITSVVALCGEKRRTAIDLLTTLYESIPDLSRLTLYNSLQRLLSLGLLCPEIRLTAFSQDTLREALMSIHAIAREPSRQNSRWLRMLNEIAEEAEVFSHRGHFPQEAHKRFPVLLKTLRSIGAEVVETVSPSAVLSVDSYTRIDKPISDDVRRAIEHAASRSFLLAAAAYPDSQECADREYFLAAFRTAHGDNVPIQVSDALNIHWELLDGTLARVMQADYKQISPVNSHTWPQPRDPESSYGQFYRQLARCISTDAPPHQHQMHVDPALLKNLAQAQPRSAPTVDVVCRIATLPNQQSSQTYEVYIESVTLPGRLTNRHWNTLAKLGEQEARDIEAYRSRLMKDQIADSEREILPVEVLATPLSAKQQNVDQRSGNPPVVLALTEPVRLSDFQRVLRLKDIYLRYDTSVDRIVSTIGPHGREIAMTYTSPISPSYNRCLHFLRYISLMGYPVLVAPKWFLPEAAQYCHIPRMYLENLVVTPERWAIPQQQVASALPSRHWAQQYMDLHIWRRRMGLPDSCFAFTNRKTKPLFVDFYSPAGLQNVLKLVSQEAESVLFEECYPAQDQLLFQRGNEPVFGSIVATMKRTKRDAGD